MGGSLQDEAWLLLGRTMKVERSIGIESESESATGSGSELEAGRVAMGLSMVGFWGYLY